jgi:hypothetical protein
MKFNVVRLEDLPLTGNVSATGKNVVSGDFSFGTLHDVLKHERAP